MTSNNHQYLKKPSPALVYILIQLIRISILAIQHFNSALRFKNGSAEFFNCFFYMAVMFLNVYVCYSLSRV